MAATRLTNPYVQFLDSTGQPVAAGTLTVYQNGTTTLANIYSDAALTTPQTNPYTLNSLGQVPGAIFYNETVRLLLKDSSGATIWQLDDVNVEADADALINLLAAKGCAFTYADVVSAGYTITAGDVVRGSNGNTYKYNSGSVVDPVTDTPYDQDTGLSNSGAWTDIVIANAPLTPGSSTITDIEADVTALQTSVAALETSLTASNGLQISNGTDADHDIDIAAGAIQDSGGSVTLVLSSVLTKQIDANWAAGDDAGGFPSLLSLAADTWYRVFLIAKPDGTVDAGFDSVANDDAAALLTDATGYSLYRQIGWVYSNSSSNIRQFIYLNGYYQWTELVTDETITGTSSLPSTRTNYGVIVPPSLLGDINISVTLKPTGSTTDYCYGMVTSPDGADVTPTETLSNLFVKSAFQNDGSMRSEVANYKVSVNSSSEIALKFVYTVSIDTKLNIVTNGFYYDPWKNA